MFEKVTNLLKRQDTLEKKLFWGLTLMLMGVGVVSFVLTVLEYRAGNMGAIAVAMAGACMIAPGIFMLICWRTKAYGLCYMWMSVVISAILLPLTFFTNGGLLSGMPIYCLAGIITCGFCVRKKYRFIAYSIGFVSCTASFIVAMRVPETVNPVSMNFAQLDIIISFVTVSIGMICLYTLVLDEYENVNRRESKEAERKAEMRLEMMSVQLENVADVKRIRHDVRHHNALILEYAQNGDLDGLKRYIKQKMDADEYYATRIYCMNAVINNILTVYTRKAQKENIDVSISADVMNNLNVAEPDLVAVLANLFENAIHGTGERTGGNRKIEVDVHTKGERLVIKCSNTCRDGMVLTDGMPAIRPGTGINSITNAANNYDGTVSYKLADNVLTCTVIMTIPAKNA